MVKHYGMVDGSLKLQYANFEQCFSTEDGAVEWVESAPKTYGDLDLVSGFVTDGKSTMARFSGERCYSSYKEDDSLKELKK